MLPKVLKRNRVLLAHRSHVGPVHLADTHRIHNHEVILAHSIGRNVLEVDGLDGADTASFHLLEEGVGSRRP